jgi:hypothetical protein
MPIDNVAMPKGRGASTKHKKERCMDSWKQRIDKNKTRSNMSKAHELGVKQNDAIDKRQTQ